MTENNHIDVSNEIFEKLSRLKNSMGFQNQDWNVWFNDLITEIKDDTTIESIFKKNVYEKFYDAWVQNFAHNLINIWNDNSVRDLVPSNENKSLPSIVIGRGPSLFEKKTFRNFIRK